MLARCVMIGASKSRLGMMASVAVGTAVVTVSASAINRREAPMWTSSTVAQCSSTSSAHDLASLVQQQQQQPNYSTNIMIPTLEAAFRAMRLVTTVTLMVSDYQLAKYSSKPNDVIINLQSEVTQREEQLHQAQQAYASPDPEDVKQMSKVERTQYKQQQKQTMKDAAKRLVDAEQALEMADDESNSKSDSGAPSSKSALHRKAATRLLDLCRNNGGVYIKVGQHVANLDYLIPKEYTQILSSLFDEAPRSSFSDVRRVLEEELGRPIEDVFDRFDETPIASASLAQVHVAHEKGSGKKLAIKVQHAGLRETSSGDIFAVTFAVRLVERFVPDFAFGWIADEIAPHLPKELDFVHEGKNSERAAEHIQEAGLNCVIPKVLWNITTPRVLAMEFEEGFKATDIEAIESAGLNKHDVSTLISSVFNSQVFLSAFVHCDPHPANVLLREQNGKPQIVLVDHGLYRSLDDDFRVCYAELWKSLMLADLPAIQNACSNLGVHEAYPLFAAMLTARPYDEIMERSKSGSFSHDYSAGSTEDRAVIRGYAQQYLSQIITMLGSLPPQMLLLLKMNDCLRHIDYALGSPANTIVVAGRYASKAVLENQMQQKDLSWTIKLRAVFDFWLINVRIQLHDLKVWFDGAGVLK